MFCNPRDTRHEIFVRVLSEKVCAFFVVANLIQGNTVCECDRMVNYFALRKVRVVAGWFYGKVLMTYLLWHFGYRFNF